MEEIIEDYITDFDLDEKQAKEFRDFANCLEIEFFESKFEHVLGLVIEFFIADSEIGP